MRLLDPPKIKMVGFYGKRPGVPSIHFDEKSETNTTVIKVTNYTLFWAGLILNNPAQNLGWINCKGEKYT